MRPLCLPTLAGRCGRFLRTQGGVRRLNLNVDASQTRTAEFSLGVNMSSSRTVLRIPLFLATVIVLGAGCHQGRRARPPASSDSVDVGYGTQAKRDVTGSVTSVNVADAQKSPVTSLADLLEGRV